MFTVSYNCPFCPQNTHDHILGSLLLLMRELLTQLLSSAHFHIHLKKKKIGLECTNGFIFFFV